MGWFDEQIKQRKLSDQEVFEDSFLTLASAVLGNAEGNKIEDQRFLSEKAIDDILMYYHKKPIDIPDDIDDLYEQLEYALRPNGFMYRSIKLEENWFKDAIGPVLAFYNDNSGTVAFIPNGLTYSYYDPKTGKKVILNSERMKEFADDGICFYQPLPLKKLGIPDLLLYMKNCMDVSDLVLFIGVTLFMTLVGFISPKLTQLLTGPVLNSKNVNALLAIAIFILFTSLSSQLISIFKSMVMNRIGAKTSLSVEAAVIMRVLSLPANFFRKYSSGELSSRIGSTNSLCNSLLNGLFSTGITSLMSLLYVFQIFHFAPALLIPSLIIIISTVAINLLSTFAQINISRKLMQVSAKETGISYALLSGIQKIKLSGAEKRAFAKWNSFYSEEAHLSYNPPLFVKISSVFSTAISLIGTVVLYYLSVRSGISQSDYFAFNATFGMVMGAFLSFSSIILQIASIRPVLEMAEPILKEVPENNEDKEILEKINGNIELTNVSFRYDEREPYIINDLSLKINAGEYIAIVGKTGCGKSTLIRLLLGFEKPEKGAIYYDSKNINSIDLRSLRRKIGTVTQNGSLFNDDIYSNIVITAPELTLQDAWDAAEIAGIADDIRRMPMGMHTMISEGQGGISGGQKQRIMIARAIAFKPKILIFDEATSALDNMTQKKIADALDQLKCTRIVIAHRLSTIKNCDRIVVLDGGKIIEDGTYDELIAQNGFFADLVERQRIDT